MTTIVYRHGILYGDSRAYTGSCAPMGQKNKVARLSDGTLVGVSTGTPGSSERLIAWLESLVEKHGGLRGIDWESAHNIRDLGKFTLLAVLAQGEALLFENSLFPSGPIKHDYYAVGSGRDFALGVFAHGGSAKDAIKVACQLDVWSQLPATGLKHDGHSLTVEW